MNTLLLIIATTIAISFISFIGALTLFIKEEILDNVLLLLVSLSAGALIGGAFLHLLPRAVVQCAPSALVNLHLQVILGFVVFFMLEQFIQWHHHHSTKHDKKPVSYLVLISDSIHNFIDGLVIAASFVMGTGVGLVTTMAISLHEIPQEIGDFGVLVYGGFSKKKALIVNFISQMTAVAGGFIGFYLSGMIDGFSLFLLPFAAGNFIYIASSDLIPEIKHKENVKKSALHFFVFLLGILLMLGIKFI